MNNKLKINNYIILYLLVITILFIVSILGQATPQTSHVILQDPNSGDPSVELTSLEITPTLLTAYGKPPEIMNIDIANTTIQALTASTIFNILVDLDYNLTTGKTYIYKQSNGTSTIIKGIDARIIAVRNQNPLLTTNNNTSWALLYIYNATGVYEGYTNINNYAVVNYTSGSAVLTLNWTGIEETYNQQLNASVHSKLHRVYILATNYIYYPSAIQMKLFIIDKIQCSPTMKIPVPNHTVIPNGSPSDWPSGSILCKDTPEDLSPLPPYVNLADIRISTDNKYIYLGLEWNGTPDYKGDKIAQAIMGYIYIDADSNPNDNELGISLNDQATYKGMIIYVNGSYKGYVNPASYPFNDTGRILEVSVPKSMGLDWFNPGREARLSSATITYFLAETLSNTTGNLLDVHGVLLDKQDDITYMHGSYTLTTAIIPAGTRESYASGSITVSLETLSQQETLEAGEINTPPFNGSMPYPLSSIIANYYWSLDNESNVKWPVNVTIRVPGGVPASTVKLYYYDKYTGSYEEIPRNLITINKNNNSVIISYTRSLYDKGDPGIIVYATQAASSTPGIIGGVLQINDGLMSGRLGLLGVFSLLVVVFTVSMFLYFRRK